uniref:Putative DNA ligase n=1 Tax=viral metagenome TaxID=1070528 RepID=A0A6H2A5U1_9ZZZZ
MKCPLLSTFDHRSKSRFVVQRHQATHLHFDFRLEMEGVLKSWAVPKGPALEVGVKRLAVEVEDHALAWIDFAGTIPQSKDGEGIIEIWDKGKYQLVNKSTTRIEIILTGEKLSGSYVLFHYKGKNWLLIKRKPKGEVS